MADTDKLYRPPLSTTVKLGSIVRHVQEAFGPDGHSLDVNTIEALLADPEVEEWMRMADDVALLPVLR